VVRRVETFFPSTDTLPNDTSLYRCLHLLPAIFATLAFMTAFLFSFWCESIKFTLNETAQVDAPSLHFGPWYQRQQAVEEEGVGGESRFFIRNKCVAYPGSVSVDSSWKTTRAFSIMAPIIGGLGAFVLWLAPCLYFLNESSWRSLAIIFIVVVTLFQGLTFLFLKSNACKDNLIVAQFENLGDGSLYPDECEWDEGSTTNVISVVLFFLTGVTMLILGVPVRPPRPPPETQTVTYQRTELPDGGHTVTEVNVVKGVAVPQEKPETTAAVTGIEKGEEA